VTYVSGLCNDVIQGVHVWSVYTCVYGCACANAAYPASALSLCYDLLVMTLACVVSFNSRDDHVPFQVLFRPNEFCLFDALDLCYGINAEARTRTLCALVLQLLTYGPCVQYRIAQWRSCCVMVSHNAQQQQRG
jgi:hypothetical protein